MYLLACLSVVRKTSVLLERGDVDAPYSNPYSNPDLSLIWLQAS
jgi:hypothetical protein